MGTNYFVEFGVCNDCGHARKRLHIGKFSGGWEFAFRGHKDHIPILASFDDWRQLLTREPCRIVSEYGTVATVDEFLAEVTDTKGRQSHHCYIRSRGLITPDDWKDPEGWSFTGCDFS